jgi:hypothetical protein
VWRDIRVCTRGLSKLQQLIFCSGMAPGAPGERFWIEKGPLRRGPLNVG